MLLVIFLCDSTRNEFLSNAIKTQSSDLTNGKVLIVIRWKITSLHLPNPSQRFELSSKLTYHTASRISVQSSTKMKYILRRGNEVEWRRHYVAFINIRHPHPGSREFPLNIGVVLWKQTSNKIKGD